MTVEHWKTLARGRLTARVWDRSGDTKFDMQPGDLVDVIGINEDGIGYEVQTIDGRVSFLVEYDEIEIPFCWLRIGQTFTIRWLKVPYQLPQDMVMVEYRKIAEKCIHCCVGYLDVNAERVRPQQEGPEMYHAWMYDDAVWVNATYMVQITPQGGE